PHNSNGGIIPFGRQFKGGAHAERRGSTISQGRTWVPMVGRGHTPCVPTGSDMGSDGRVHTPVCPYILRSCITRYAHTIFPPLKRWTHRLTRSSPRYRQATRYS